MDGIAATFLGFAAGIGGLNWTKKYHLNFAEPRRLEFSRGTPRYAFHREKLAIYRIWQHKFF
ncbi:hypothetical protein [Cupriavidus sp. CuC1]|uniref:hypothetical protein n=1 Tax=Cupriavidus sp. CuC1 TaxID=3373131 RepID=UPI0037D07868